MERIGRFPRSKLRVLVSFLIQRIRPGAALPTVKAAETRAFEIAGPTPSPGPAQEARVPGKLFESAVSGDSQAASARASLSSRGAPFLGTSR